MPWRKQLREFSNAFKVKSPSEGGFTTKERLALIEGSLALSAYLYSEGGQDSESALILCAIILGTLEKKPLDVSSISSITGIPRATVQRKLTTMPATFKNRLKYETVGRRVCITLEGDDAMTDNRYQTVRAIFLNVCEKLSAFCPLWALF